mmetsp:Transcript_19223/g.54536  ORF Transcript_19223/g.54536 Transcript_19223/m.54536 type:complete len:496 (+) Transcript_19223:55-1542(+)
MIFSFFFLSFDAGSIFSLLSANQPTNLSNDCVRHSVCIHVCVAVRLCHRLGCGLFAISKCFHGLWSLFYASLAGRMDEEGDDADNCQGSHDDSGNGTSGKVIIVAVVVAIEGGIYVFARIGCSLNRTGGGDARNAGLRRHVGDARRRSWKRHGTLQLPGFHVDNLDGLGWKVGDGRIVLSTSLVGAVGTLEEALWPSTVGRGALSHGTSARDQRRLRGGSGDDLLHVEASDSDLLDVHVDRGAGSAVGRANALSCGVVIFLNSAALACFGMLAHSDGDVSSFVTVNFKKLVKVRIVKAFTGVDICLVHWRVAQIVVVAGDASVWVHVIFVGVSGEGRAGDEVALVGSGREEGDGGWISRGVDGVGDTGCGTGGLRVEDGDLVASLVGRDDEHAVGSFVQGTGDGDVLVDEDRIFRVGDVEFEDASRAGAFQVEVLVLAAVCDGVRAEASAVGTLQIEVVVVRLDEIVGDHVHDEEMALAGGRRKAMTLQVFIFVP